ncbi:hypothetical protein Anas_11733 [Armadillidium nasatum]|uniref:Uncharacterized protein n=1 Tax=Armadillidium nasatum TaxID=96803 RepID=A0A5N5SQ69_9CRUS|nr:hypothetical protein Anas_11733 [Armadillidium nasatum]
MTRDCPQRGSGERGRGRIGGERRGGRGRVGGGGGRVGGGGGGGGGRVSFNFTRLGGRGRGVFRGRSFESEVKPTHIFFDDDD